MVIPFFGLILAFGGIVIWYFLDRRETFLTEKGLPRRSGARLVIAAIALLVMLLLLGLSLAYVIPLWVNGEARFINWEALLLFGVLPFLVCLAIWWLAMRRGSSV
jgi:protein-S-isoprenylcysteine O-methyltransferase Ste14